MVSHSNFYGTKLSPQHVTDISIDIAGCLTTNISQLYQSLSVESFLADER
ncbi:hypothetical protein ACEYW6_30300 [Nostoc sp. UIC 10607]